MYKSEFLDRNVNFLLCYRNLYNDINSLVKKNIDYLVIKVCYSNNISLLFAG